MISRKNLLVKRLEGALLTALVGWSLACGGGGSKSASSTAGIEDLGTIHGASGSLAATAINSSGDIVGVDFSKITDTGPEIFRWTREGGIELLTNTPVSGGTSEVYINDSGEITFVENIQGDSALIPSLIVWRPDVERVVAAEDVWTIEGLNNEGKIIGCDALDSSADVSCWLLSSSSTGASQKQYYPSGWLPKAINNLGDLLVTHIREGKAVADSVVFAEGTAVSAPTLGGESTSLFDLNERGLAVGESQTSIVNTFGIHAVDVPLGHAVVFDAVMQTLTDIDGHSNRGSFAQAINSDGYIVGWMYDVKKESGISTTGPNQAFIYHPKFGMRAISDLLPNTDGWELQQANDINDNLEVVGSGYHNGNQRAFRVSLREFLPK